MKLYNMNLSNFATKSRIAIYDKGLPIEMAEIPGGNPKSAEYQKINPLGKIPCLDANGTLIFESEVINEYLEEKFPSPSLMPSSPEARAQVRLFTRLHDLYLDPPLRALFGQLNPKNRDDVVVNEKLSELQGQLDLLDNLLAPPGNFAAGPQFTLADCALAPTLFFITEMLPGFGARAPLESRPKLNAWWTKVRERASVARALGEMEVALKALTGS